MPKKHKAIIISHTHWDRAWYMPFEKFRIGIIRLVDLLLEIMEGDSQYKSFTLDGQTVAIEDYLEIKPYNRSRIEKLVKAKRLMIGPLYVLPDEFLEGPEAMVRNFLIGHRISRDMGHTMKVGYIPDPFGHIQQLPQILKGFGIDNFIFTRGLGEDIDKLGLEFLFKAPDGSDVIAVLQKPNYGNASNLGYSFSWATTDNLKIDYNLAVSQINRTVKSIVEHSKLDVAPLYNGIDHVSPQRELPKIIKKANEKLKDVEVVHGNLEQYAAFLRKKNDKLKTFSGELNSGKYSPILQGVYSSRMYLKQSNNECENLLVNYLEPSSTFSWLIGRKEYPEDLIRHSWKTLLKNHPHDDICGCSTDAVHEDMIGRFKVVREIGENLLRDNLRFISNNINLSEHEGMAIMVYNPICCERRDIVNARIFFDVEDFAYRNFKICDGKGNTLDYVKHKDEIILDIELLKTSPVRAVDISFMADAPSMGYETYFIRRRPSEKTKPVSSLNFDKTGFENKFYSLRFNKNGSFNLQDKLNNVEYKNLNTIEDTEDAGDEYNYSYCKNSKTYTCSGCSARIEIDSSSNEFARYRILLNMKIPKKLSGNRRNRSNEMVTCRIVSFITCYRLIPRIDIKTMIDNKAEDHRMRALFSTDIETDFSYADGHFDVMRRPIQLPDGKGWIEMPSKTKHQRSFVDLCDRERGLAILNRGLPEYEIIKLRNKNIIALTLFRSVGWLSREDLLTRSENAGPEIPTPAAQCHGTSAFEYAVLPHAGNWEKAKLVYEGLKFNNPLILHRCKTTADTVQHGAGNKEFDRINIKTIPQTGILPTNLSFIQVIPDKLIVSAVKKGKNSDLILRLYNPTNHSIAGNIKLFKRIKKAEIVNLNEELIKKLDIENSHNIKINVPKKKILTLRLFF